MQRTLLKCRASLPLLSRGAFQSISAGRALCLESQSSVTRLRPLGAAVNGSRALTTSARWRQEAAAAAEAPTQEPRKTLITEFKELETLDLVHPTVIQTITERMGLKKMTDIQTATINEALSGVDLVGQAKTGTGKTLAFLMPIFQKIIALDPSLAHPSYGRTSASDIRAIIISPTRELAEQIAVEARRVSNKTGVIVQAAVGGTQKSRMLQQTRRDGCHILIATPGRLADLLTDPSSGIDAPRLNMLVLDEADRLLDQGFWQDIQHIRHLLPEPRENNIQTMMFSATVPREVVAAVRETLQPGFRFIKCVRDDEEPTHERVPQYVVRVNGMQNYLPALYELCLNEVQKHSNDRSGTSPFKAIVYFKSTAMVELAYEAFMNLGRSAGSPLGRTPVYEMHSKLTQAARTSASEAFRRANSAILLSSDVTARGMDFPNVTHVLQMGVPQDAESYVHRIGRTARAGKEGTGYLFIHPLEESFARKQLGHLPLKPNTELEAASVDMTKPGDVPQRVASVLQDLNESFRRVSRTAFSDAYMSLLGIHQFVDNKQALIDSMNDLTRYGWGLEEPPAIPPKTIQHLGLRGVRGINHMYDSGSRDRDFGRGRSGDRGFGDAGRDAFSDHMDRDSRGGFGGSRGGFGGSDRGFGRSSGSRNSFDSGRGRARW